MTLSFSLGYFYGIDSIIDLLIALVAGLIAYQSRRVYVLTNKKTYNYFSWAFVSIGVAFLAKIFANLTIRYDTIFERANFIISITQELHHMQLINFFGFTFYKIFLLAGFLILFLITTKTQKKGDVILFGYFSAITLLFSIYFDFVFYLTLAIILAALTTFYYRNYKRVRSPSSYRVYVAFLFILISHVVDLFLGIHILIYLLAELLIFIGFLILLVNHTKVKNDQKKNQIRGNKRPSGSSKKR